ncbi:MAG: asparagine synthase (glutamine-hydrolyzing) [Candidatus Cloacimonetes bacterium]|nr:asparagine synthase (glutamine-hydrolyzing) [Candidatus Cloacimonadota bacterium]
MCGITGVVAASPVDAELVRAMTDRLAHRGPDDAGVWTGRSRDRFCSLGHRRLSIIDLSEAGHQPMTTGDGRIAVTYNGEIYNWRELRAELEQAGHVFTSQTDTEVLLHGYREWGEALLSRLNGMFALGIWDGERGRLLLARDRFGQKPLHWWRDGDMLAFASEPKALLAHPGISAGFNPRALSLYLAWEYVPCPWSVYEGVRKLPAGHMLLWEGGEPKVQPWWNIRFEASGEELPQRELEAKLVSLLQASIQRRLMSDVPLGVFLSGGIDSSSVVALLAEMMPASQIKTFAVGFAEQSFDESSYARRVARLFGTDHHERRLSPDDMLDIQPEIFAQLDEPFADSSIIPTYLLSRFTRQHVTVALGGDGGDELFAGYDPFLAHMWARWYEMLPRAVHDGLVRPLANRLPTSTANMSFDFKLKHFLKGVYRPAPVRNQMWLGAFSPDEQLTLLTPDALNSLDGFDPYGSMQETPQPRFRDAQDEIAWLYQRWYLADDILFKVDRASMMVSLETRTPFLDVELAEFANSLPSNQKLRGTTRKHILKRAMKGRLPHDILHRKKKGFGVPLAAWFKGPLQRELRRTLRPERLRREGWLRPETVLRLIDEHAAGVRDNRKKLWTLYVWHKWREHYLEDTA